MAARNSRKNHNCAGVGTSYEAAKLARQYIAAGYSVDIGLMQINSRNLSGLGYTVEQALDPCRNVRGGVTILTADYVEALQPFTPGRPALQSALSALQHPARSGAASKNG
jgi:hypothetical protein